MRKTIFIFLSLTLLCNIKLTSNIDNNKKETVKSNIIGKIIIPSTNINYYILQSNDNTYYLNHNYKDEEDIKGSIFLDYRNNINDKKLIIYGHNSKDSYAPFKELSNYLNKDYYNTHKNIIIELNNKKYNYEIFSILITNKDDISHTRISFNNKEYKEYINYLKNNSIYATDSVASSDNKIIMIQTCNYSPDNTFLLVTARRTYEENI